MTFTHRQGGAGPIRGRARVTGREERGGLRRTFVTRTHKASFSEGHIGCARGDGREWGTNEKLVTGVRWDPGWGRGGLVAGGPAGSCIIITGGVSAAGESERAGQWSAERAAPNLLAQ